MNHKKVTYKVASKLRAHGFTYREIAEKLGTSLNTVGICLRMGSSRERRIKEKKLAKINEKIKRGILKEMEQKNVQPQATERPISKNY